MSDHLTIEMNPELTPQASSQLLLRAGQRIAPASPLYPSVTPAPIPGRNALGFGPRFVWYPNPRVVMSCDGDPVEGNPKKRFYQFGVQEFTAPCSGTLSFQGVLPPGFPGKFLLDLVLYDTQLPTDYHAREYDVVQLLDAGQFTFPLPGASVLFMGSPSAPLTVFELPTAYQWNPPQNAGTGLTLNPSMFLFQAGPGPGTVTQLRWRTLL